MNAPIPRGPERRILTPLAAGLTRLARLINDANLPDASLAVQADGRIVSVNATLCPSPVDVVNAWAAALHLPVETAPAQRVTATVVQASGAYDDVFYVVRAIIPTEPAVGRTYEVRNDAPVHVLTAAGGALMSESPSRDDFVASLRTAADAFQAGHLPVPTIETSIHLNVYGDKGRAAFLAARDAFPSATPVLGNYFVELPVGPGVTLTFSKDALCTKRTESRDVEVYDIDPQLLEPVVTREEQNRRDAADDMRSDAQAEAHAEAQALGYHDDDCRATIEHDAMLDEIAAQS